jgi:tRNA uracil 4-sulfurtransferase
LTELFALHYAEVALKGKNRPKFVATLRRNVSRALQSFPGSSVESRDSRIIVRTDAPPEAVGAAIAKVFGVSWFARARMVAADYDTISGEVAAQAGTMGGRSFMISARRTDKSFAMNSMELARSLGGVVAERTGKRVDLRRPDDTIHVDVLRGSALVYSKREKGPGGLPVGTGGRVVHLFSGGIDSPVAAWLLMKRGCIPLYLHFYLSPSPEYALESKITALVRGLAEYGGRSTLVLVPFAEYQVASAGAPQDLEPSLFRRFMRVTAEALADRAGAAAVSTGDSLSQAASQTIWNVRAFDSGSTYPILRPLLTFDKQETIDLARSIGTYEPSIQEYKDCCAIITRHPKTRVDGRQIDDWARTLDFPALASACLARSTLYTFNPATGSAKVGPLRLEEGPDGMAPAKAGLGAAL